MTAYPATVSFDLSGSIFEKQMARLQIDDSAMFDRILDALANFTGLPWDQFERDASVEYFETSFDGSYIVLRFHLLDEEVRLAGQLAGDILLIGAFHKPIIHIEHDYTHGS